MQRQTNIAATIDATNDKVRYDSCAKKLLSFKAIEAMILKSCVNEFYQYSVEYIAEHCLPGEAEISEHAVHQDQPNKAKNIDGDYRLTMMNSESSSVNEGTVYYDVRFMAVIPDTNEPIGFIINLEIQTDDYPGYELVTRGLYYCARMISEQHGTVFTGAHYERIRKVYSIWICPQASKQKQYSMIRYNMTEQTITGRSYVRKDAYDLMEVVMLNLGDVNGDTSSDILDFLSTLFSLDKTPNEKKAILSERYKIAMTAELESEVQSMCNLGDAIERRGIEKGIEKGIATGLLEGRAEGKIDTIKIFLNNTHDAVLVATSLSEPIDYIRKIAEENNITLK